MKWFAISTVTAALVAGAASCNHSGPSVDQSTRGEKTSVEKAQAKEYYTCPMHPEVHSDHPGECPICHMRLVKKSGAQAQNEAQKNAPPGSVNSERKIKFYRHPMNPSIHSEHPAKDDMGMDYIPIYEDEASAPRSAVPGRSEVSLTPEQQATAGILSVTLEERELAKSISMPGRMTGGSQVSFQVFEEDLGMIRAGAPFTAQSPSLPGVELSGRITSIDSLLDPMSRTGRVVGVLKNPDSSKLRVESSIVGVVKVTLGRGVALPEAAVLHTGTQDLVYLEKGPGQYTPQSVKLGPKSEGYYQVIQGLDPGARVAAGPNFLLDSESRIRATYDQANH